MTEKTDKFFAFAPTVLVNHANSIIMNPLARLVSKTIDITDNFLGIYKLLPHSCEYYDFVGKLAQSLCNATTVNKWLCDHALPSITVNRELETIWDDLNRMSKHYPSGVNIKSFVHLGQMFA